MNRQISILENTAVIAPKLLKEYPAFRKQIVRTTNTSVTVALNTKKRLKKLIQLMATASKLEAKSFHRDSKMRRFGMGRSEFYVSLLKSAPRFGGTDLEHPFLNKALKRLSQNKHARKRTK